MLIFNQTLSAIFTQVSPESGPRNRDAKVLRTSAGEDRASELGWLADANMLLWWLSPSDVELSMADCRARGVSHSFGIAFSMNGMHELTYANRFIQLGSSLPHRICNRKQCSLDIICNLDSTDHPLANAFLTGASCDGDFLLFVSSFVSK